MNIYEKNIAILNETLAIFEKGSYQKDGRTVRLKATAAERLESRVFLPRDKIDICNGDDREAPSSPAGYSLSCENTDSFSMAMSIFRRDPFDEKRDKILVLNFANPVHIGGGARSGSKAQEEDLCRKSSLLISLESESSFAYYRYNRSLRTNMASDAMIVSPKVEIIRDRFGELLGETFTVGVLTCAAPYVGAGLEGMTHEQYRAMLLKRITRMLRCAAFEGYTHLVFGAWGCGVFGNDAQLVAELFSLAIRDFEYGGRAFGDCFKSVGFAVLDRSAEQYNFKAFERYFSEG